MGILNDLISEGVIVLWHHYKRNARDRSGNENHGSHLNTFFSNRGIQMRGNGKVEVADSSEIQVIDGTWAAFGNFIQPPAGVSSRIMSKEDAGGTLFDWFFTPTTVNFTGQLITLSTMGKHLLAVNASNGIIPEVFFDGYSVGSMGGSVALTADDAPLLIGNEYQLTGTGSFFGELFDVLLFSRQLTAPEHASLYTDLQAYQYRSVTRPWNRRNHGGVDQSWYMQSGIVESTTQKTTGLLENSGFKIQSGTFQISFGDDEQPIIDCVVAGIVTVDLGIVGQTASQMAYGTWDCYVKHAAGNTTDIGLITTGQSISNGYGIQVANDESVKIVHYGVGDITTTGGSISADTWTRVGMTRDDQTNDFTLIIDGQTIDTGNNDTITEGKYMTLSLDTGDQIRQLSKNVSIAGNYEFLTNGPSGEFLTNGPSGELLVQRI